MTIPKKVIAIEGDLFTVEDYKGNRQKIKSIIELKTGDFIYTQQNVAVGKFEEESAREIFKMINGNGG